MTIGPIQVIVFGFDRTDQFRGEVLEELAQLRGRGLIRLIDLMVAVKEPDGTITSVETNDLSQQESAEFGRVLGKLLSTPAIDSREVAAAAASLGLDYKGLRQAVENLQPGKAFGVLMFEHTWAIPLGAAIRRAGGVPLAQGFVTPEALVMVGEELNAIAEAAAAIEVSEIVQSAAILDTLATLEEAEAMKTAIAADVVRHLVVAGVLEEEEAANAIETLAAAGLLQAQYLDAAVQLDAQEAAEDQKLFAEAMPQVAQHD
jgi:uncharacterized membrane protein